MNRRSSAYEISVLGILSAIIILQSFIPFFGNITIPGLPAITTVHITVIIGAVILGTRDGVFLGGVWGLSSLIRAYTTATDPLTLLLFRNPLIAIVPRLMVGLVAGLIFNYIAKNIRTGVWGTVKMSLAGIFGALTNTAFFVLFTWLMYMGDSSKVIAGSTSGTFFGLLIALILGNAIVEVISAGIITPIIGQALMRFKR